MRRATRSTERQALLDESGPLESRTEQSLQLSYTILGKYGWALTFTDADGKETSRVQALQEQLAKIKSVKQDAMTAYMADMGVIIAGFGGFPISWDEGKVLTADFHLDYMKRCKCDFGHME